jgi:hypothetical protein
VKRRGSRRPGLTADLPVGITPDELASHYPKLYHMAEAGTWPGIVEHGLLSTSALVRLFEVPEPSRTQILSAHRPAGIEISHPRVGRAVVRDQIPMSDAGLKRCLQDGLTPADWYRLLNVAVFFWLTEERLERLLGAGAYRERVHTVITMETRSLLVDCSERTVLSPINSGCTRPFPRPRGRSTFLPLGEYPFQHWRKKRGLTDAVVELAVQDAVRNVTRYAVEVRERRVGERGRLIWSR